MQMSMTDALIATAIMALVTLATRAIPFLFFSRRKPPKVISYPGKYLPPAMVTLLVIYAVKDVNFFGGTFGLPELIAGAVVAGLYLWKKNSFLSIFGGTALYMVLVQTDLLGKLL